jgi:hypothetical protein
MNKINAHIKSDWYKYIIEIFVVVIGIMVAFSLNNWKESVMLKTMEMQLYSDLIQELHIDLDEIQGVLNYNNRYLSRFNNASEIILTDTQMQLADTIAIIALELANFSDFDKRESAYEVLASSGKLDMVTNKNVLRQLQQLGILYTYINRLEKNHEQLVMMTLPKITDYLSLKPFRVIQKEALYNYKFHNTLQIFIHILNEKEGLYKRAENGLNHLIISLEEELN